MKLLNHWTTSCRQRRQLASGRLIAGICGLLVLAGCSAKHYRNSADKEVYGIIKQKSPLIPNMESKFTIETNALVPLDGLPMVTNVDERLGDAGKAELGSRIVSLEKALEIAVKNSRNYQNQKEQLYLQALSLTLERYRFTPIFSGNLGAHYQRTTHDIQTGIDTVTEEDHVIRANGGTGVDILTRTGGRLAADFTTDFLRFVNGDMRAILTPRLAGSFTQPLWRGAGYKVTMENLTQAERNLLYAMREFVRFRKSFSVQVASDYYRVLQARDAAKNQWLKGQAFQKNARRTEAMTKEGVTRMSELGRMRQSAISTDIQLNSSLNRYRQLLDQFKISLGLPTDTRIILDGRELDKLKITDVNLTVTNAVKVAMAARLDFYNTRDQFEDASRKIPLAINGLRPDLNLVLAANVDSKPGSGIQTLDFRRTTWSADLNLDLPLNRKAERNTYRTSLITYERALRALALAVDNIKLEIYNDWRNLQEAKSTYESSVIGVEVNQQRVDEQNLLAELGRATAIEQVDSQNALTDSQDNLTAAKVNHTITRLGFWRDLGILNIKDNGLWDEINNVPTE